MSAAAFANNVAALSQTQPRLAADVRCDVPETRPVYARDGSLTAFGPDGQWWHGCSVPLRAAETMLAKLDLKGRVACLLGPTLAAHVRVPLLRSRQDQALIAVCPDPHDLRVLLRCDDFLEDILSHRLWFAWGDDWVDELNRLFGERPGLATPAQFIRLPTTPSEQVDAMVSAAQAVFAETNATRTQAIARRRDGWRRRSGAPRRLCVIAPSHFRLWDDAGSVLADTLGACAPVPDEVSTVRFDPDDAARSSALALLETAGDCDAVMSADTSRRDLPGVVPPEMPWLTWITRAAAIPPFDAAGPADALVLADPAWRRPATAAGWPSERVSVGGWPILDDGADAEAKAADAIAVVADTRLIVMPEQLEEFSSHQLLWNHIAAELAADPFAVGDEPGQYLEQRMKRFGVSADGFDAALFLERLILPGYAQAIVRRLAREGRPPRLFGHGWSGIADFALWATGPVTSRAALHTIRRETAAVVDVSPVAGNHPLHRLALPIIRLGTPGRSQDPRPIPPIDLRRVLSLLAG